MAEGLNEGSGERPARIAFAGGGAGRVQDAPGRRGAGSEDDDNIQVLEEEDPTVVEAEHSSRKPESKPAGIPKWVFAVAAGVLVFVVVGAGMLIMSMRDRWTANDEVLPLPQAQSVPQPAMQQEGALAVAPAPVSASGPVVAPPVAEAPGAQSPPPSAAQQPDVPSPAPPTQVAPAAASGADPVKVAVLEAELVKALGKIDDLGKRLAKMESAVAAASQKSVEAKPVVAVKPPAPAAAPKVTPAPAKPAQSPAVKPAVKPLPVAAKAPPPKAAPAVVEAAPTPPARLAGYSVMSMIGTRAWLVKRNPDGSEAELSVTTGEKIEGRTVTSVDGSTRCVTVEGGQKICVRQ